MSSRSSISDSNGLCLTTSNTSSLASNSSNSTSISNISNKFKNVLNRKRSKSLIIPENKSSTLLNTNLSSISSSPNINTRNPMRNRSLGSIQFSPSQISTPTFENLNIPPMPNHHNHTPSLTQAPNTQIQNQRSNSTSTSTSISDVESINLVEVSAPQLFRIDEKSPNNEIKINKDERFFDDIADGILERVNNDSKVDWSI